MRRTYSRLLIAASLLVAGSGLSTVASAQYYQSPSFQNPNSDRALFNRTRSDLDRAASYPYQSRSDRKRFDEARRDLFDFSSRFDQGRYEKHQLDKAIDKIQDVLNHNSIDSRERGSLDEDLRRMRDFRAFRDHKVYRDYGYR
jgi:hypothetical protein